MNNVEINFSNGGFKINAELKMDGDQWCVGIGKNIQEGLYVFASTPERALIDFKDAFRNYTPDRTPEVPLFKDTWPALDKLKL